MAIAILVLATVPALAEDVGWPVEIDAEGGWVVTLYQPQVDGLEGNDLNTRAAVSVTGPGVPEPVFGAVWIVARLEVDRDRRMVSISDVQVPDVRFPEASEEGKRELAELLEREIPSWDLEISVDRLVASLKMLDDKPSVGGLKHDPPTIMWSTEPAVLVSIDGEPKIEELPGQTGQKYKAKYVVNTPFPILFDTRGKLFYLFGGGDVWFRAREVMGPWEFSRAVPATIKYLIPEEERFKETSVDSVEDLPKIIVVTEPSELIQFAGEPEWAELEGLDLAYVSNSNGNVLLDTETRTYYVVLSGRWYRTRVPEEGSWEFVPPDELPERFSRIPADSAVGGVLVHVAGTREAREAVLDAQIPETAAVKRDATIWVRYDGQPRFNPIEGTELEYAVNTSSSVIKAGVRYYCCEAGVWYGAEGPKGPWKVETEIPEEIYGIPPSNRNHNVTYVRVYDTTETAVYTGYTSGYIGGYYFNGCTVYGTGWHYPGWYGTSYYPGASTWGFHAGYSVWGGWGFGTSWSNGPVTISIGIFGSPMGGWWGMDGYHPFQSPYPYPGYTRSGMYTDPFPVHYGASTPEAVPRYDVYARPANFDRVMPDLDEAPSAQPRASSTRSNDIYTDRSGDIYRANSDGTWDRRTDKGGWKKTDPPEGTLTEGSVTPRSASSMQGSANLEEERQARARGEERASRYQPEPNADDEEEIEN
jgi:hypothetical protein